MVDSGAVVKLTLGWFGLVIDDLKHKMVNHTQYINILATEAWSFVKTPMTLVTGLNVLGTCIKVQEPQSGIDLMRFDSQAELSLELDT